MAAHPPQIELRLVPAPVERTLEFTILRALGDPGVVPCPICRGHLRQMPGGVACERCGCEILRGAEDDEEGRDNVMFMDRLAS